MKSMSLKSNEVLWLIEILAGFSGFGWIWVGFAGDSDWDSGWHCRGSAVMSLFFAPIKRRKGIGSGGLGQIWKGYGDAFTTAVLYLLYPLPFIF